MIRTTLLGTALVLSLTGCARLAESRLNPLNWFGGSQEVVQSAPGTAGDTVRPLVPEGRLSVTVEGRELIQSVQSLRIERTPGGAIVHATGLAATQGYFNAQLVNRGIENGVLTLDFRAQGPSDFEPIGTERSRRISAAYVIDERTLAGIRTVRVQGASNARTSSR